MPYNNSTTDSFASTPASTSSSLLRRVKGQNPDAWRRLVRLYGPLVFLWCRRSGFNREDSADVVQEVWTAVSMHIAEFRRERPDDSFRGWLWTITRNKVRDRLRNQEPPGVGGSSIQNWINQLPDDPPDSIPLAPSDKQIVMRQALELIRSDFEDCTWKAFWRTAVDDRPAAEVAEELEMTPGAVRQVKYRILRRLREEMDGLLE
jgi:RNA polymerase sigma-70 factor, ECF subfamily